jgi:hypothetical protein
MGDNLIEDEDDKETLREAHMEKIIIDSLNVTDEVKENMMDELERETHQKLAD